METSVRSSFSTEVKGIRNICQMVVRPAVMDGLETVAMTKGQEAGLEMLVLRYELIK